MFTQQYARLTAAPESAGIAKNTLWVRAVAIFLEFTSILIVAGITLVALINWVERKHPRWRNIAAFALACGGAYAASFVLDMFLGSLTGYYPFSPLTLPVFTWSGIAIALQYLARSTSISLYWAVLPYWGVGLLAVFMGFVGPHKYNIAVGAPLVLFGLVSLLNTKAEGQNTLNSNRQIFSVGEYKLDATVAGFSGLTEFSPKEYAVLGRAFEGETDYDARPVMFLGRSWQLQLATVHGRIYKIAPYVILKDKGEANALAIESLHYCTAQLGKPTEQRTGFFVWDAIDGNVVLQTAEIAEGFSVSIFLTSQSVKTFKKK